MDIQIAKKDLGKMSWHDAVEYCNINAEWRLPTKIEMNWIYKNYFKKGSKILVIHSGGLQGNRSLPFGTLLY